MVTNDHCGKSGLHQHHYCSLQFEGKTRMKSTARRVTECGVLVSVPTDQVAACLIEAVQVLQQGLLQTQTLHQIIDSRPVCGHSRPHLHTPAGTTTSLSWAEGSLVCTRHLYLKVEKMCRGLRHEQWKYQSGKLANLAGAVMFRCCLWEIDKNQLRWPTWARCGGICRVHMAARWWCGVAPWGSSAATGTQGTASGQWWCRSPGSGRQTQDTHTSLSKIFP